MATCKRPCLYRVPKESESYCHGQGCRYIEITGHSRVARVYKQLGVKQLTAAAEELLRPKNCPCFVDRLGRKSPPPEEPARKAPAVREAWRKVDPAKIRALYEQGLTGRQIAEKLECTTTPIYAWRKRWGKAAHAEKPRGKVDPELALKLYLEGKNDREIGEAMGCSHSAVAWWRTRNGLQTLQGPERYDWSKALPLYRAGATDKQIAAAVGCSVSGAREWRRRVTEAERGKQ